MIWIGRLTRRMKQAWDAIVWWEIRRIPFNLLILAVGLVSMFWFAAVGSHVLQNQDIGSPFITVAFYALAVNFCTPSRG